VPKAPDTLMKKYFEDKNHTKSIFVFSIPSRVDDQKSFVK
jgi:hypothetical protein